MIVEAHGSIRIPIVVKGVGVAVHSVPPKPPSPPSNTSSWREWLTVGTALVNLAAAIGKFINWIGGYLQRGASVAR
jgi:hypothetical protein